MKKIAFLFLLVFTGPAFGGFSFTVEECREVTPKIHKRLQDLYNSHEGFSRNVNELLKARLNEPELGDLTPSEKALLERQKKRIQDEFEEKVIKPMAANAPAGGVNASGHLRALISEERRKQRDYLEKYEDEFLIKRREDRIAHNERISQVGKDLNERRGEEIDSLLKMLYFCLELIKRDSSYGHEKDL